MADQTKNSTRCNSKRLSSNFHNSLGKDGLSGLTKHKWDKAILKQVESFLSKGQRILDVGCGYGRIAIPLLKKGYDVCGIDLSANFIKELKKELPSENSRRKFRVADMCDLPFNDKTFDVALCLWSVFDELLLRKEQVKALSEMRRVLKRGGLAFIESHIFIEPAEIHCLKMGRVYGHGKRIVRCSVDGAVYNYYNHDSESMKKNLERSGIMDFSVRTEWFGWRERLIVRFWK